MNKKDIEMIKNYSTSFYLKHLNDIVDECTNKNLDFESARLLKQAIEESMNKICDSFIEVIKKINDANCVKVRKCGGKK